MNTLEALMNQPDPSQPVSDPPEFDREQWKAHKQQELDDAYRQMDDITAEIVRSPDAFRAYLDLQANHPGYSASNILLILSQKREVTNIASFKDWQEQGRYIKRGEAGLKVLMPSRYTREDGTEGTAFHIGYAFDVSQTHADKEFVPLLPEIDLQKLIGAIVHDGPAKIAIDDNVPENIKAVYHPEDKTIHIRSGLDDATVFRLLARESAHAVMATGKEDHTREKGGFQAYCASYLVCKRYGVAFPEFKHDMAREFMDGREPAQIRSMLNEARQAAEQITWRIGRSLAPEQEPKKQPKSQDPVR